MIQFRQILCPVDFSEFSQHAVRRAVAIARPHGGTVTILHVMTPEVATGTEGTGIPAQQGGARDAVLQEIQQMIRSVDAKGVRIDPAVVEAASVYREILAAAERLRADVVVLGTHGRSGFERLLLGSITERVLRRAPVPVMTVPVGAVDGTNAPGVGRILCAVDFSESSRAALTYAAALARGPASAHVTVLHVIETLPVMYEPNMAIPYDFAEERPALETASREYLRRFVSEAADDVAVEEVVSSGKPYVEILRVAVEEEADLIVLGVHGHNVLDRIFFGSTAGHVVRGAACPVLTVRAPAPAP